MKQKSLFGNLPKLSEQTKELNKSIVQRASAPKKSKTTTIRAKGGSNANTIAKRVATVVEAVKSRLVDTGEFECIRDVKRFREYMKQVRAKKHMFPALDTETTGLDPIDNHMVGLCLYVEGEKPAYIPVKHTDLSGTILDNQVSIEVVREELEQCIDEEVEFVFHNAVFDMRVLKNSLNMSRYVHCKWNTQIAGSYLNENEPHGLKYLWNKYINKGQEDESESFNKLFEKIPFNFIPVDIGYIYAAKDAKLTHEVFKFQQQYLDPSSDMCEKAGLVEAGQFYIETEVPLITVLCEMEDEGIAIDEQKAKELSEQYNKMMQEVQEKFNKIAEKFDFSKLPQEQRNKISNPVNLNSPQQLSIIIYDYLKLKSVDRKSPRGTGEEILEKLINRYSEHQDFFETILEFRGISKLLSTYIEKMPALVKKEKTNRLHGSFNPYGAKTGRFSSSDPNLQNIPARNKEIRKMFIADEDTVLIGGDFSQQEPRVLAHLCFELFKCRKMLDAYLSGKDLYSWMASEVYSVPYDECKEFRSDGTTNAEGKKRRSSVKDIVLGLMYGRSTKSIAQKLGISEEEAQRFVDMLFNSFPAIKDVVDYYIKMTRENGFVMTIWGRKRRLPDYNLPKYDFVDINDRSKRIEDEAVRSHYWTRMENAWGNQKRLEVKKDANSRGIWIIENDFKISEAERQILNSVVQGSSADITKKAMVLVGQDEQLKAWGYKLLLTVHDELIGKAPKVTALKCAERMRELMLQSTVDRIVVPMSVDCEIVERWYGEDVTDILTY